eukprot:m.122728 g.122728  ORF g.122728 m.122728 type:complete len:387 (+) comp15657_c0_seq5:1782-2942(+)
MSERKSRERYRSPQRKRPKHQSIDEEGYIITSRGETLDRQRYIVRSEIGCGTFGKVFRCYDTNKDNKRVAIKVVKAIERYREAAETEVAILMDIARRDPNGKQPLISLLRSFDHQGHLCLVFPLCTLSLFEYMEYNQFSGFELHETRNIGKQCLQGLAFLHRMCLTHTDLKPENIMLVSPQMEQFEASYDKDGAPKPPRFRLENTRIQLIDFGSAHYDWQRHTSIVSTRHYRAPEVILNIGWSRPCDLWSLGCILFELHDGRPLFETHDNFEHLAMMEKIVGYKLPPAMMVKATIPASDKHGQLRWPEKAKDESSIRFVERKVYPLRDLLGLDDDRGEAYYTLSQALSQLLTLDPFDRVEARDALNLPFFQEVQATQVVPVAEERN